MLAHSLLCLLYLCILYYKNITIAISSFVTILLNIKGISGFFNIFIIYLSRTPWPFSKSKFNLKSDCVNLLAPASSIECLLHLPNVWAIQYHLGPERLTRLGNSNEIRLPVLFNNYFCPNKINYKKLRTGDVIRNFSSVSL